jgi:hypothetical protein
MCEVKMDIVVEFDNTGRLVRAENTYFIWKRSSDPDGKYGYGSLHIQGSDVVRENVDLTTAVTEANEIIEVAKRLRNWGA